MVAVTLLKTSGCVNPNNKVSSMSLHKRESADVVSVCLNTKAPFRVPLSVGVSRQVAPFQNFLFIRWQEDLHREDKHSVSHAQKGHQRAGVMRRQRLSFATVVMKTLTHPRSEDSLVGAPSSVYLKASLPDVKLH